MHWNVCSYHVSESAYERLSNFGNWMAKKEKKNKVIHSKPSICASETFVI